MNIFGMMKQFKSLQDSMGKFKEELEKETVVYEDDNFRIVSRLTGEVVELKIKTSECENLEKELLKALQKTHEQMKEKVKEKAQNSLFGSLGLF
jgi:DNA-binding protein YbaB